MAQVARTRYSYYSSVAPKREPQATPRPDVRVIPGRRASNPAYQTLSQGTVNAFKFLLVALAIIAVIAGVRVCDLLCHARIARERRVAAKPARRGSVVLQRARDTRALHPRQLEPHRAAGNGAGHDRAVRCHLPQGDPSRQRGAQRRGQHLYCGHAAKHPKCCCSKGKLGNRAHGGRVPIQEKPNIRKRHQEQGRNPSRPARPVFGGDHRAPVLRADRRGRRLRRQGGHGAHEQDHARGKARHHLRPQRRRDRLRRRCHDHLRRPAADHRFRRRRPDAGRRARPHDQQDERRLLQAHRPAGPLVRLHLAQGGCRPRELAQGHAQKPEAGRHPLPERHQARLPQRRRRKPARRKRRRGRQRHRRPRARVQRPRRRYRRRARDRAREQGAADSRRRDLAYRCRRWQGHRHEHRHQPAEEGGRGTASGGPGVQRAGRFRHGHGRLNRRDLRLVLVCEEDLFVLGRFRLRFRL